MILRPPISPLFPYTTLFRSSRTNPGRLQHRSWYGHPALADSVPFLVDARDLRSEEHTSELQSPVHPVCRLLLEKTNGALGRAYRRTGSAELESHLRIRGGRN